MNKIRVGLLTIGQSPREDLVPEIKPLLHPYIEIIEYGLFDNLRPEEVEFLIPKERETPLVTRMRDGRQIQLSEQKIIQLMPKAIKSMIFNLHVEAVGVLCTHDFPNTKYQCPTIFPFDYLQFLINQVLEVKTLGVVVPLKSQIEMTNMKWGERRTIVEAKSPYTPGKTWEEIAQSFTQENVDTVILDCIGYKTIDRWELQDKLANPILLPLIILAYAINQIV